MEGGKMEENVKQDTTYEYNSYQYTTTDTIPISSPTKGKGNDCVLIIK